MPYCPECGVEIGGAAACPLCGEPNPKLARSGLAADGAPGGAGGAACGEEPRERHHESFLDPEERERLTLRERRVIVWEILSVSLGLAGLIVLATNLLVDRRLSWSLYVLASIALAWVLVSALSALAHLPRRAGLLVGLAIPAFLLALDAIRPGLDWAPRIAMPIAFVTELAVLGVVLLTRASKRRGANVAALVLLGISLVCLGIEASVALATGRRDDFSWSAIVALCLVPIAAFLFYLHYRIGAKADLRKLFRL